MILTTDDSKTAAMVKLNKDNGFTNSTDNAVHKMGSPFTKPGHAYSMSFPRVACYVLLQASNSYLKRKKKTLKKKKLVLFQEQVTVDSLHVPRKGHNLFYLSYFQLVTQICTMAILNNGHDSQD